MSARRERPAIFVQLAGPVPAFVADLEGIGLDGVVDGEHLPYVADMQHPNGRLLGRRDRTHAIADIGAGEASDLVRALTAVGGAR